MKKQTILVIGAGVFSLLFYKNNLGLNVLLFSIVAISSITVLNPLKIKKRSTLFLACVYFIASLLVFINNSALAFITSIISFFVFLGSLSERRSSIYIKMFNGFFSTIASGFYHYFNNINDEKTSTKKNKIDYLFWTKIIGIPLLTVTVFVILYRSANPIFDEVLQQIDFDFINFQWFVFTLLGYFLLSNIIKPTTIEPITVNDVSTPNQLLKNEIKSQPIKELIQENQLGIVLLTALNFLIIFFLITDGIFLAKIKDLTAPDLSKAVHEGIYALITSIIFAIIIIMYFFRGNLNFYKKNQGIKVLSIIWIALNIFLIFNTCYKNYLYSSHFGLTYKRIGVFVYLILTLIGLITTFIKVYQKYNSWFLLRKNISIAFTILVVSSFFNWDVIITKHNTRYSKIIDIEYLTKLKNNTLLLNDYLEKNKAMLTAKDERLIKVKYENYFKELEDKKWQELTYKNLKQQL